MNKGENAIKLYYKINGFKVINKGSPDFLCYRQNENSNTMHDITFVEVKQFGGRLTKEQELWKEALTQLGLRYKIEYVIKNVKL